MNIYINGVLTPPADAGSLDGVTAALQPTAGKDGQVVTFDEANDELTLAPASGGFANPMTTEGDIIVAGPGGTPVRLPAAAAGYFLRIAAGRPAWREFSAAGLIGARPGAAAVREGMVYWATDGAAGLEASQCLHKGGSTYAWEVMPYGVTATGAALVRAANTAAAATAVGLGAVTATGATAAAALAAVGGEVAVALLPVSGALHHWRLGESSSPFADSGSSPVNLAYVSGPREYGRAGVYARYGATMQRAPSLLTNRAEAVVADIPSGSDLTVGVTIANEDRGLNTPSGAAQIIVAVTDATGASRDGILILTTFGGSGIYVNVARAGASTDTSGYAMDWSRPHRVEFTRVHSTGAYVLYVDGIARLSGTIDGTIGACTRVCIGGTGISVGSVVACALMMADVTVHLSALSAATMLTRADASRRLVDG